MGIGDQTDPTTDFFDTHRAQCVQYADKLRGVPGAESVVAKMDEAVALCDAAIANGRRRVDMSAVVAEMPAIVTRYEALPAKTKTDLSAAIRADVEAARPAKPTPLEVETDTQSKEGP